MKSIGWILLILGFAGGLATFICISISEARHRRRLQQMKEEADLKREDYFVLSDKIKK